MTPDDTLVLRAGAWLLAQVRAGGAAAGPYSAPRFWSPTAPIHGVYTRGWVRVARSDGDHVSLALTAAGRHALARARLLGFCR